jgi:hypothetical protein
MEVEPACYRLRLNVLTHNVHRDDECPGGMIMRVLPLGSFYSEPANIAHFVEVRESVTIQVTGNRPSGRKFGNPAEFQK